MKRLTKETLFSSKHRSTNLAKKSIKGGVFTLSSQMVRFVIRTSGTMVYARLLAPNDFGLIGMVAVITNFAEMFRDAGLSMSTVQKDHISHEQISTLFWINVVISLTLGLLILSSSPFIAMFYNKPELVKITAALSFSFFLGGIVLQHNALLRRHFQFGSLSFIDIFTEFITLLVTVLLAILGWNYWALITGMIVNSICRLLLVNYFCSWLPGRWQKGTGVREMLRFGGFLTGFNIINYFSRNLDNILIGKFIGANALGLYSRAYNLFMLPITQVRSPITNVALPTLSTLKDDPERYKKYYRKMLDILAMITLPITAYCIVESDFIIGIMLGSQWAGAVTPFRYLAVAGLIQPIASTRGIVLLSHGLSKEYFIWGIINAVFTIAAFIVGLPYGITGVAIAYAVINFILLFPSLLFCFNKTPVTVRLFLVTIFFPVLITGAASIAACGLKYFHTSEKVSFHSIILVVFFVTYAVLSVLRKSVRENIQMLKNNNPLLSKKRYKAE